MRWPQTPEEEETFFAMWQGILLVIVPGMLFVFGLIYLAMPPYRVPPQDWANGTYTNPCCAPLILRDGTLTANGKTTHYVVSTEKSGNQIDVAAGIGVRNGRVEFGGNAVFVHFNDPPRYVRGAAKSLHLFGPDGDYAFVKQP